MKLTFELVAATNLPDFNEMVNQRLAEGFRFVVGHPMIITPREDGSGKGLQYSAAMLLEEEG